MSIERVTTPEHLAYLEADKSCYCLQPDFIPFAEALWRTQYGAVTLGRAIEIKAERSLVKPRTDCTDRNLALDYTVQRVLEDERFIDMFGFSSKLD